MRGGDDGDQKWPGASPQGHDRAVGRSSRSSDGSPDLRRQQQLPAATFSRVQQQQPIDDASPGVFVAQQLLGAVGTQVDATGPLKSSARCDNRKPYSVNADTHERAETRGTRRAKRRCRGVICGRDIGQAPAGRTLAGNEFRLQPPRAKRNRRFPLRIGARRSVRHRTTLGRNDRDLRLGCHKTDSSRRCRTRTDPGPADT